MHRYCNKLAIEERSEGLGWEGRDCLGSKELAGILIRGFQVILGTPGEQTASHPWLPKKDPSLHFRPHFHKISRANCFWQCWKEFFSIAKIIRKLLPSANWQGREGLARERRRADQYNYCPLTRLFSSCKSSLPSYSCVCCNCWFASHCLFIDA